MERTRYGRPLGAGRVDRAKVEATTDAEIRQHMIEDGFDPGNPLAGMRPLAPIAALRARVGLSEETFAHALRIPLNTLRDWEQGRAMPDPVARSFFMLVEDDPQRAFKVLAED